MTATEQLFLDTLQDIRQKLTENSQYSITLQAPDLSQATSLRYSRLPIGDTGKRGFGQSVGSQPIRTGHQLGDAGEQAAGGASNESAVLEWACRSMVLPKRPGRQQLSEWPPVGLARRTQADPAQP